MGDSQYQRERAERERKAKVKREEEFQKRLPGGRVPLTEHEKFMTRLGYATEDPYHKYMEFENGQFKKKVI